MRRVEITKPMVGIFAMQVCAVSDATDEEILDVCNRENPAGTTNGWSSVYRVHDEDSKIMTEKCLPVQCQDDSARTHFLVLC